MAGSLPFLRWHSGTFVISARPGFPGKFPLGLCSSDQEHFTPGNQADAHLPAWLSPPLQAHPPTSVCPKPFRDSAAPTGGGEGMLGLGRQR